ncbi:MAG: beta-propeller domain-containing protein [Frankiaceae bacterium]|nr:beta-propeller domain-containing protein [Frankiaceae bacterium]
MLRTTRVTAAVLLALATTACTSGQLPTSAHPDPLPPRTIAPRPVSPTPEPTPAKVRPRAVPAALTSYGDCGTMVRQLRREAAREVGPYGLPGTYDGGMVGGQFAVALGSAGMAAGGSTGGSAPVPAAAAAPAAPAAPGFSGTNNQEADVDEPDLVKTDGRVMVVVQPSTGTLQVVDVENARVRARLPLSLPGGARALLIGDTAVVLGQGYGEKGPVAVAHVIDLGDPDHPSVLRTYRAEGSLVDARLLRGRVLLVVQASPQFAFTPPVDGSPEAATAAQAANRRVVRRTSTSAWLPRVTVTPGGKTYRTSCGDVLHPGIESGVSTTTVITLDPETAAPTKQLTVVGSSSVVYASTSALYLATSSWEAQRILASGGQQGVSTDLHGFDVSAPDELRYLGTGSVTGTLTDQYAMSEHDGDLRVATTIGPLLPPPGEGTRAAQLSDNKVTILRPTDGVLLRVGEIKGLGRGERIYGVRFIGAIGYVVTFRQTDPLYVLDLTDPTRPRLDGELHVTGYSSSLYPLGDGRLLGIGQAVDTHLRQVGTQVSVFDVSRRSRPTLRSKVVVNGAHSLAESDHHSLLWWSPSRLLVVPVSVYSSRPFEGSIVYDVSARGTLREVGRVRPPSSGDGCCYGGVLRTVVVGTLLYSITERGIVVSSTERLDDQAWMPFR